MRLTRNQKPQTRIGQLVIRERVVAFQQRPDEDPTALVCWSISQLLLFDLLFGSRSSLTSHVLGDLLVIALAVAIIIPSSAAFPTSSPTDDTRPATSDCTRSSTTRSGFLCFSRALGLGLSTSLLLARRAAGHTAAYETGGIDAG